MKEDLMSGPCVICGATNYNLSMGGPTICPSCDCGDFGLAKVQRQSQEISQLRAEVEEWKERWVGERRDHEATIRHFDTLMKEVT